MKFSKAKKILILLISISLLLFLIHLILNYISINIYNEKHAFLFELSNRFDLNDENSVPQWFTQTMFFLICLSSLLAARLTTKKQGSGFWLLIAGLGLIMSIDDAATLHEFVLQTFHNTFFLDVKSSVWVNAWLILLPFILIGSIWLCYKAFITLPKRTSILITLSGGIYLFGAIILDSWTNHYVMYSFMEQGLMGGLEGGFQMIGLSLLFFAIADYLEVNYSKQISDAVHSLRPTKRSN